MAPLLLVTPAWLVGIFMHGWLQLPPIWSVVGAVVGIGLVIFASFYNRRYSHLPGQTLSIMLPLCLTAFCLGALRLVSDTPSSEPGNLLYYANQGEVKIVGVVSGDPVYTERSGSYRLSVREIYFPQNATEAKPVSGDLFVRSPVNPRRNPGDLLELSGKLEEPKEVTGDGFPYRDWLARQGIFVSMSYPVSRLLATGQDFFVLRWLSAINNSAQETILKFVPEQEGGLLVGILLGERVGITPELNEAFRNTGTSHIVAISGSNITIAIGLVTFVLGRFFRKRTTLVIALLVIAFYVVLVGASPSVVRAGLMGAFTIGGLLLGRDYEGLLGLEASALIMTAFQPRVLWDIGFELSFVATLGLIIIARPLQEWSLVKNWPPLLKEGLLITISAEMMTLPLAAFYFHQVSFVSLASNIMAVPALEAIMATGLVAVVVGWIFGGWLPLLAVLFGYLAWIFLAYLITAVEFFGALPFAATSLPAFHPLWLFYYYSILGLVLWVWRDPQKRWRLLHTSGSPLVYGGTALVAVVVWAAVLLF
jgi:competence protein ComEC